MASSVEKRMALAFLKTPQATVGMSSSPGFSSAAPLALPAGAAYPAGAVKPPFVNAEEPIDRFVGRRTRTPDALSTVTSNKANAIAWRKTLGGIRVPRGVYRFKTHEAADEWLWQMIARPRN